VVDLSAFAGHHVVIVTDAAAGVAAKAVGTASIAGIVVLQLYHSLAGRAGTRPRGWGLTLAVQVLLLVTLVAATIGDEDTSAIGMAGFPAGSALLLLTGWWAWLAFTVLAASVGVHWVLLYPAQMDVAVYLTGVAAATGLAVYGLSRLTDLAETLAATRRELARAAVDRERLRVAQDTHDLLGLGLSAVALKCDLAGRLIGRDDAKAHHEMEALLRLAAQARAEIQAVTTGEHGLSLHAELAAAREALASAGVDVDIRTEPARARLPERADAVLATVLREAVTNVLRHAEARRCEIELVATADAVCLRVSNDGAASAPKERASGPARRRGGHGLANLTARARALGGRLGTHTEGDRFELTVRVPVPVRPSPRPGGEHPLTPGDPVHGVDEAAGRTVLHDEP
jgi:two-component system, NarL family, sensor histidine kinase DesK